MKTLEPNRIQINDVANWFKLAMALLMRRPVNFVAIMVVYFAIIYIVMRATLSLSDYVSPTLLLSGFVTVCAFVFFLVLTAFVLHAESADHSHPAAFRLLIETVLSFQKVILRMALMALVVGAFYWVLTLGISRERDILTSTERVIDNMLTQQGLPFQFECQLTATFLYFLFLATFSLRLFFAIALAAFHNLDYRHAQSLSHKAVIINIRPMSLMLLLWAMILMVAMKLAPLMSVIIFPFFGIYLYVAYRQVFLGITENLPAKAIVAAEKVHVHVNHH